MQSKKVLTVIAIGLALALTVVILCPARGQHVAMLSEGEMSVLRGKDDGWGFYCLPDEDCMMTLLCTYWSPPCDGYGDVGLGSFYVCEEGWSDTRCDPNPPEDCMEVWTCKQNGPYSCTNKDIAFIQQGTEALCIN